MKVLPRYAIGWWKLLGFGWRKNVMKNCVKGKLKKNWIKDMKIKTRTGLYLRGVGGDFSALTELRSGASGKKTSVV